MTPIPPLPGLQRLGHAFVLELGRVADRLGIDKGELAVSIFLESGFNTQARNPESGATGLIQWLPETAEGLGTTTAAIAEMSAMDQLALVETYMRPLSRRIRAGRPGDVYVAIFRPANIGAADTHIIAFRGTATYDQNSPLDAADKGYLTVGDIRFRCLRLLGRRAPSEDGPGLGLAAAVGLLIYLWGRR
jgi:hypothetical protein